MKKRFKKVFTIVTLLFVLVTALALPILAYSGSYGNLSSNMLNYDVFYSAEWKLTDERMEIISDNVYRMNLRTDIAYGQSELYPYYTTNGWFAKTTSYIPFKTVFPYVRAGDTLNMAYYTNNNNNGGISFRVMDGTTTEEGPPNEWWCTVGQTITVTESMLTQGSVTFRVWHNQGQSNNVYLRALGVYVGNSTISSSSPSTALSGYAQAVYTTWRQTQEQYKILFEQTYQDAIDSAYGNGYIDGKKDGYAQGKQDGYSEGVNDSDDTLFPSLLNGVFTAPMGFLTGLFDWELFGVNIWSIFKGFLTLAVMLVVVRFVLKWVL